MCRSSVKTLPLDEAVRLPDDNALARRDCAELRRKVEASLLSEPSAASRDLELLLLDGKQRIRAPTEYHSYYDMSRTCVLAGTRDLIFSSGALESLDPEAKCSPLSLRRQRDSTSMHVLLQKPSSHHCPAHACRLRLMRSVS